MVSTQDYEVISAPALPSAAPASSLLANRVRTLFEGASGRSVIAMLDQVLVSGANFLMLAAVARLTGAKQTGTYVLALRTVDFITEIQNVFIWAPYTLFAPGFEEDRRRYYAGSILAHQALATLVTLLILGTCYSAAVQFGWQEAATIALWSMLAAAGIHLREFVRRISFANLELLSALLLDLAVFAGLVVSMGILYLQGKLSGETALLVAGGVSAIAACVHLLANRRHFALSMTHLLPDLKRNLSYGRWLLGSDLALLLGNQIYPWFLVSLSGSAAVAIFASCQAITNFARMFLIGAQNILLPGSARAVASGSNTALRHLVRRATLILGGGTVLFCAGSFLASQRILSAVYGNTFVEHGPLVFVLSLSILATAVTLAPTFALAAAGRADANLRINAITLALHLTVGLLLVRLYGALGAAYGLAFGGFIATVLRWHIYRRLIVREDAIKVNSCE